MDNHLQIQIGKLGGSQYDGSLNFHVTPFIQAVSFSLSKMFLVIGDCSFPGGRRLLAPGKLQFSLDTQSLAKLEGQAWLIKFLQLTDETHRVL